MVDGALGGTTGARPDGSVPSAAGFPTEGDVMARAGGENFTVATRLLPSSARRRLLAIYGWSRLVDQLGDAYAGDRLDALDRLEGQLDAARGGRVHGVHPLVVAAATTVAAMGSGRDELRKLIAANRADQHVRRYETFADLRAYCALSARPVGRLVLAAFDATSEARVAWSDAICDGLQLVEHWQDLGEDVRAGRIYLPNEDLRRFGVDEIELAAAAGGSEAGTALRALVGFETARARALLLDGAPLVASLRGRARVAVAGFVAGGLAAADALAASGFDPFSRPATPARPAVAAHAAALLSGRVARSEAA